MGLKQSHCTYMGGKSLKIIIFIHYIGLKLRIFINFRKIFIFVNFILCGNCTWRVKPSLNFFFEKFHSKNVLFFQFINEKKTLARNFLFV